MSVVDTRILVEGDVLDMDTRDTMPITSLVDRIKAEHAATAHAFRNSLDHALRCGALLAEARPLVEATAEHKRGAWGRWLKDECGIPDRTARLYIELHEHREVIAQAGNGAELSLNAAKRLISPPKDSDTVAEPLDPIERAMSLMEKADAEGLGKGMLGRDACRKHVEKIAEDWHFENDAIYRWAKAIADVAEKHRPKK